MKIFFLILTIVVSQSTLSAQLSPGTIELINFDWNTNVKPIFKQSCFNCHSNQTKFPWYYKIPGVKQFLDSHIKEAREHLDFTDGFPFAGKETRNGPIQMFQKIQEEIDEGEMPLPMYQFMHPESKLNAADRKTIKNWINKSIKVLNN